MNDVCSECSQNCSSECRCWCHGPKELDRTDYGVLELEQAQPLLDPNDPED